MLLELLDQLLFPLFAFLVLLLAIEDVRLGNLVAPFLHQAFLDEILDFLDGRDVSAGLLAAGTYDVGDDIVRHLRDEPLVRLSRGVARELDSLLDTRPVKRDQFSVTPLHLGQSHIFGQPIPTTRLFCMAEIVCLSLFTGEPRFYDLPIYGTGEGFQILRSLEPVIDHERVLENIHHQKRHGSDEVAEVMLVDPDIE